MWYIVGIHFNFTVVSVDSTDFIMPHNQSFVVDDVR